MAPRRKSENQDSPVEQKKQKTGTTDSPLAASDTTDSGSDTTPPTSSIELTFDTSEDLSPLTSPSSSSDDGLGVHGRSDAAGDAQKPITNEVQHIEMNAQSASTGAHGNDLLVRLENGFIPDISGLNFEGVLTYIQFFTRKAFDHVRVLRATQHLTDPPSAAEDIAQPTALCVMEDAFPSDPVLLVRLARLCALPGSKKIKNIALIPDPKAYSAQKFIKINSNTARFFLLGSCAYSQLNGGERNHQICIIPFVSGWDRGAAMIADVFGKRCIYYSSFKGGISFSSSWKREGDGDAQPSYMPTVSTLDSQKGKKRIPNVLSFTDNIPIFDAINKPFDLAAYEKLAPYGEKEVPAGAAVMPIFTISKFAISKSRKDSLDLPDACDTQISFNIQAVVILAYKDFFPRSTKSFNIQEHAFGVAFPTNVAPTQTNLGSNEQQEDEEDEGGVMI